MSNATNNLKSRLDVWHYQFDPADASVATKSAYVRVAEHNLLSVVVRAGALVTAKIFAATDSAGTGSAEVKAVTAPTTADAKDDRRCIEVSADDVTAALAGASHICVEVDMNGSTDDCSVCLIREGLRFTTADMTADITS
jgi:hypothetical protein